MKHQALLNQMTLADKIALCSGADFYSTKDFEQYGIPSITMVDGPHGLRKQAAAGDPLGATRKTKPIAGLGRQRSQFR